MTISNQTYRIPDARDSHPRPKPAAPSHTCKRNYEDAKVAFLATVADPQRLTGNGRLDSQAWEARSAEYDRAKENFERVYQALSLTQAATLLDDYRETSREAMKRLSATIEPPPVREYRIDDGVDRTIPFYFVDPVHGDLLLGTVVPDDHGQFDAFAADGTNLGKFIDQASARAAIRADAGR